MRWLLFLNAFTEITIGVLFLIFPEQVLQLPGAVAFRGGANTQMLMGMYGTAALLVGLLSFGIWWNNEKGVVQRYGLLYFALFHTGLSINQFLYNPDWRPGVMHGLFALGFWLAVVIDG